MSRQHTWGLILVLLLALLGYNSFYTVPQGETAIKVRLGNIVYTDGQAANSPGLHVKWPFVDAVYILDTRLQTLAVDSPVIYTDQQNQVDVDYYVKWRINDIQSYYTTTHADQSVAERLLQQKVNTALRALFGTLKLDAVISDQRSAAMSNIEAAVQAGAEELGVKVVDFRINAINLPTVVSASVFQRMRSQREQAATQIRSDGRQAAEVTRATADADVTKILASAKEAAAKTRAAGEQQAADIYAKAYGSNPSFYEFYKSLNAYQSAFSNKQDVIVVQPNSDFFKYFNKASNQVAS